MSDVKAAETIAPQGGSLETTPAAQINSTTPDAALGASEAAPAVAPAAADPVAPASEPAKLDTKAEAPKETKTTTKEKRASGFFKKLFGKKDKNAETS